MFNNGRVNRRVRMKRSFWIVLDVVLATVVGILGNIVASHLQERYGLSESVRFVLVTVVFAACLGALLLATLKRSQTEESHQEDLTETAGEFQSLPPRSYHRLIGRRDELEQILSALRDPKRKTIVAIFGLGGIGKTALAREAVEQCRDESLFDGAIWISFQTEQLVWEDTTEVAASGHSFADLLADIGRQFNRVDIVRMRLDQRVATVTNLLATRRVLLVMDNFDAVPHREQLMCDAFRILGQGKLLITSRHRIDHEQTFALELDGLSEDEAVMFLREEGRQRGVEAVTEALRDSLVEIHKATGGAPLAMKLVVGQMSRLPMKAVLDALRQAAFQGPDYPFYRFVYQRSWEILGMDARKVLVDISVFPPITGGALEHVQAVSELKGSSFWSAVDQLVILSLVDKVGRAGQERLALHPLTQYFIHSDITKQWNGQSNE